jgi:hypothetical protein
MSIQVLSQAAAAAAAAAMGSNSQKNPSINNSNSNRNSTASLSLSQIAGNSSLLSAIAARNARDLAQLRAWNLNAPSNMNNNCNSINSNSINSNSTTTNRSGTPPSAAGLLTSVGQEPQQQHHRHHTHQQAISGIVSHLRAQTQQEQRLDIEALLRVKVADNSLLALRRAYHGLPAANMSSLLLDNTNRLFNSSLTSSLHVASLFPQQQQHHHASSSSSSSARLAAMAAMGDSQLLHHLTAASMTRTKNNAVAPSEAITVKKKVASPYKMDALPRFQAPRRASLFMDCDEDSLSEYQCLIRQQMELFEATQVEAASSVQGRNKQIQKGQVGIRCRHCTTTTATSTTRPAGAAASSSSSSSKRSLYFPTKLDRIYQAAQNLSSFHLCGNCPQVPKEIRNRILVLRERKSPAGGGKRYWAEGVRCLGVYEDHQGGLFFQQAKNKKQEEGLY